MDWVDGIVHERVVPNKSDHIIWELLGGSHIGCKCSSWALKNIFLNIKLIKYLLNFSNDQKSSSFQNT